MRKRILGLLISGLVTSMGAFASGDLNWGSFGESTGTYSYNGGTGAGSQVSGLGIHVASVLGEGSVSGFYHVDAKLDFTSGLYAGGGSWSGPGDLMLTGCILNASNVCAFGTTSTTVLVDDVFSSVSISPGNGDFVFGQLTGTFDPTVQALFSIGPTFTTSLHGLEIAVRNLPAIDTAFVNVQTDSGNLVTKTTAAVPESWSMISSAGVFTFALGIFGFARRRGLIKTV